VNDTNDGLSAATAWKHAPGDPNATVNPVSVNLLPGDTVLFKGGVKYRGGIRIAGPSIGGYYNQRANGTVNNPIKLIGDQWPGLVGTKAIIDGSQ